MNRKKIKHAGLLIISIILLILLSVYYFGPRIIIKTSGSYFKAYRYIERRNILDLNVKYDSLHVTTTDGYQLRGYLVKSSIKNQKGTIILLHGIRAVKEIYITKAEELSGLGYNTVIFDLRAHGESEGKFCTYGYKEKYDVSSLCDTLDKIKGLNRNYIVWGQSLGGAIALQALEIDNRLKAGIVESTFSDLRTVIYDYINYNMGFKNVRVINYMIKRAEMLGRFVADDVVPVKTAENITQPVMVVHGEVDNRIDPDYGKRIYEKLASEQKKLVIVDSAKHSNVWEKGGENYFNQVMEFIEDNISVQEH